MALLEHKGFKRSELHVIGSKFLISNGYFGYRGTLDESDSSDFVGINLNGVFDGVAEVETVNAYNPLFTMIRADGINLHPKTFRPKKHKISLDTETGIFKRRTEFTYSDTTIIVQSERFIDQVDKSLLYSKYMFKSNKSINIELFTGIDDFIWNIADIHLENGTLDKKKDFTFVETKTKKHGINVCVGLFEVRDFDAKDTHPNESQAKYDMTLEPERTYTIIKYAGIVHSRNDGKEYLRNLLTEAKNSGWQSLQKKNKDFWEKAYDLAQVAIYANTTIKNQIDYAIYQLISHRPYNDYTSVPTMGLSGQFNQGGIHWNTEIMILPFYINTDPISARHMVMYRVHSLHEAQRRAEDFGFEGALYPALSSENGIELDTRNHRNSVHINGSIVYGVYQYVERTADYSVLFQGALEMLLECARFYLSYSQLSENKKHYDFLGIKGIDHTHAFIDNEAYTNQMVKNTLDAVIKCVAFAKQVDKNEVKDMFDAHDYENLVKDIRELRRRLYTKKENIEYMIEAFDGYFSLEDADVSTLKKVRFIETDKSLITKQRNLFQNSNVLAMLALFREDFGGIVHRINYDYYMRRSVNPDYFSRILYIIEACESNLPDDAYEMYEDIADLNIDNEHLFKRGLNLALLGGIYIATIYGFAGVRHHTYLVSSDYNYPTKIRRIEFKMRVADNIAYVKIKRNSSTVKWSESDDEEEEKVSNPNITD